MHQNKYQVRYIGGDAAEIRRGEVYQAEELLDSQTMIGVLDRSGEWYAYPKILFQVVSQYESIDKITADIYTGINSQQE